MKLTDRQIETIKRILDLIYRSKRTLVALSCVVVFITTYMLILPALTLEKEEAVEQGGISLETTATEEVTAEEAAGIVQEEPVEAVQEESVAEQPNEADNTEAVEAVPKEKASAGGVSSGVDAVTKETEPAETSDPLTFEGENFTIAVADEASVLPSGARIDVQEIIKDDEEYTEQYEELYTESLKALQKEEGKNKVADLGFAKFYDITLLDGETAIQPDSSVNVTIEYDNTLQKELSAKKADNVRIIHFAQDENTGEIKPEILDSNVVEVNTNNKDKLTDTTFQADGFSVYAIVYTVDFHYEINGKKCDFGIPGGGFVSLEHLMQVLLTDADSEYDEAVELNSINVSDTTKQFVEDVESVSFSAPDLVWVGKAEANTTVGALKDAHNLDLQYSADLTEEQIAEIDAQTVKAGDWALISLRPFDTEETLIVTMKNGDKFTVKVTDAHEIPDSSSSTIDRNKSYLICYQVGNTYYLLKNDGTVDSSHNPQTFENLNSTYCWSFNYVFEEKHLEDTMTYVYYLIRPIDHKSWTLALNEDGNDLVQPSNNNVAVVPVEGGGFNLIGYNEVKLNFDNGAFFADELPEGNNGIVVHIYEMDTLPTYEYTARSSDEERGTVTIAGGTQMTEADGSHYYDAESNSDKMNAGTITATPVSHQNPELHSGDEGFGENKWEFDHWEQDGIPLDRDQYPATINANTLPIPFNGSNLIAHFKQNPSYVVPDSEKEPSSFEDMSNWLNDLTNKHVPLDESATDKTSEVYDYENRIYRVDIVSKPNFRTFKGNVDLAFCMDVSNSMYFPSKLVENVELPIYQINWSWTDNQGWHDHRTWLDQSRDWEHPYYLIADTADTATVFKVYYQDGNWKAQDASRETETDKSFIIGQPFETSWTDSITDKTHPFNAGDDNNSRYMIYNAGDSGRNRFYYLNQSFTGALSDLTTIRDLLKVAGDDSPDVRFAYNTFNKSLGTQGEDFQDVYAMPPIDLSNSHGGGTRPDQAFINAQGFDWTGEDRYVILITDGAPQGKRTEGGEEPSSITQEEIYTKVRQQAQNLKDNQHVKFITIGLSLDKVPMGKRILYDLADYDSEGTKMFYMAESASDLPNILRQVINTIMDDAIVFSDVTDTVGEAFYPVDKSTGLKLNPGDMIDIEGRKVDDPAQAAGTIQRDGKTVKWNHQALDPENGWHGTIYVKAQEDLIGGNAVKTNGDAGIVATGYRMGDKEYSFSDSPLNPGKLKSISVDFETPRVNVNELIFPSTTTEWTVYLGTEVDPEEHIRKMYEDILVTGVVNTDASQDDPNYIHYPLVPNSIEDDRTTGEHGTAFTFSLSGEILEAIKADPDLSELYVTDGELNWDKFLEDIQEPNGVTVPYHKYGTEGEDSNIQIKLTKEIIGNEKDINDSPHETTELNGTDDQGNSVPVEKYVLTVQYNPDYDHVLPLGQGGHGQIDYHTGTYGSMYQGHASGRETSTSIQDINVYAKKLELIKVDQSEETITNNPAVFGLYRKATSDDPSSSQVSITGLEGKYVKVDTLTTSGDGTVTTNSLKLLEDNASYYLIEEQAPGGFNTLEDILKVSIDLKDTWTKKSDGTISSTKSDPYEVSDWVQDSTIFVKALNDEDSGAAIRVIPAGQHEITYDHTNDTTVASVTYMIVNDAGVVLPEAGGIGTTIFYVLGSMLVLGCGIFLISRRRIAK